MIEITDDMVERVCDAAFSFDRADLDRKNVKRMKYVLDTILNPPEILVSEAMRKAGAKAWQDVVEDDQKTGYGVSNVYRAMEMQRRLDNPDPLLLSVMKKSL